MDEPVCDCMEVCDGMLHLAGTKFGDLQYQLTGDCQRQNARTVLVAIDELLRLGWTIDAAAVKKGFSKVCSMTGLMGRWMQLSDNPLVICDTGHNIGGWEMLSRQLRELPRPLVVVLGFVNDKEIAPILPLLPKDAEYVFTNASIPRALPAAELAGIGIEYGLRGTALPDVGGAYDYGMERLCARSGQGSMFVGGSTFVVADLLKHLQAKGNVEKNS